MRRVPAVLATLLTVTGRAAAHGNGDGHLAWAPPVVFVTGVVVLATSVYADQRSMVDRTTADAGVLVGVLAVLVGGATLFL